MNKILKLAATGIVAIALGLAFTATSCAATPVKTVAYKKSHATIVKECRRAVDKGLVNHAFHGGPDVSIHNPKACKPLRKTQVDSIITNEFVRLINNGTLSMYRR